jgi:catechol-2,3-dioxygenase
LRHNRLTDKVSSEEPVMETQELHRGRLIDHIELVVQDLPASRAFYSAIFEVLQVPRAAAATIISGTTSCSFPAPTARPRRAN